MKLFQKFFSKPHRKEQEDHPPVTFEGQGCWWYEPGVVPLAPGRGFNVSLVGESQWQDNIGAIIGGRCEEGHNCQVPAELVLEGDPRDPNAVAVTINSQKVGWIPTEQAADARAALSKINPSGAPVACKAKIVGGWKRDRNDQGYFGVKLSLSWPLKVDRRAGRSSSVHS